MQEQHLKAELFVQPANVWWTLLALSAACSNQFDELRFVRKPSGRVKFLFADASLISSIPEDLHPDTHVIVILWDGFQSYLEYQEAINDLGNRVRKVEIRAVGDPSEWDTNSFDPERRGLLFPQSEQLYSAEMLRRKQLSMFSFSDPVLKAQIIHRSTLISSKVALQLLLARRQAEYEKTRYVFCGQTGIETLRRYSKFYGLVPERPLSPDRGLNCDDAFVISWIAAVLRNHAHWTSGFVLRGLLRLIALRALYHSKRDEIFLNVFPAANINAYQASMLFRRHVFLEFGGICGNEAIYPRTADIAFWSRKMLRFTRAEATERMMQLDHRDVAGLSSFANWYNEQVSSTLDRSPLIIPSFESSASR